MRPKNTWFLFFFWCVSKFYANKGLGAKESKGAPFSNLVKWGFSCIFEATKSKLVCSFWNFEITHIIIWFGPKKEKVWSRCIQGGDKALIVERQGFIAPIMGLWTSIFRIHSIQSSSSCKKQAYELPHSETQIELNCIISP